MQMHLGPTVHSFYCPFLVLIKRKTAGTRDADVSCIPICHYQGVAVRWWSLSVCHRCSYMGLVSNCKYLFRKEKKDSKNIPGQLGLTQMRQQLVVGERMALWHFLQINNKINIDHVIS